MDLAHQGRRPAVATSKTAASADDRAARGVTAVHVPDATGTSFYSAVSDSAALAPEAT